MQYRLSYLMFFLICFLQNFTSVDAQLRFIENRGQWPSEFNYAADIAPGTLFLSQEALHFYILDKESLHKLHERSSHARFEHADINFLEDEFIKADYLRLRFTNANKEAKISPLYTLPEYYNYFIGHDSSRWASDVTAYRELIINEIYPGIKLRYYSEGNSLKYDWIVAPEADANAIRLQAEGAQQVFLSNGQLIFQTSLCEVIEASPLSWQIINGERKFIPAQFVLHNNFISFEFPEGYDPCYELIIDPLLIFSTYTGSQADNWGNTATPGERGTLYAGGVTNHATFGGTFPATPGTFQTTYGGVYDAVIIKYDSTGQDLLFATYLGGSQSETPHSIVLNDAGELVILGTTSSFNFPTTSNAYDRTFNGGINVSVTINYLNGSDLFISKLSADGKQLLASTYLGGSANDGLNATGNVLVKNYGDELRGDIITDAEGNIYLVSVTSSSNFPGMNSFSTSYLGGPTDAVLVKMNADLSEVLWSAFIGGASSDAAYSIKIASDNSLYVAGGTASFNMPVSNNAYQKLNMGNVDGWIMHIANDGGEILHSTYTGNAGYNQVYFIDLNDADEVYAYGQTSGGSFPVTAGVYSNPNSGQFVQKFSKELSSLVFSTVIGSGRGTPDISPTAFLVNDCNNLFLSGWGGRVNTVNSTYVGGSTSNMPLTADALQSSTSGSDFYFMVLTDDATEFLYGTYLGGNNSATHVDGGTSRFDKSGIVYHAVCAGCTAFNLSGSSTSDFPTTPGAWSRTNNSGNCNLAAFKFDLASLRARIQTNTMDLKRPGIVNICIPDEVVFQNLSTGGEVYEWDLGDGTQFSKTDTAYFSHQYAEPGTYIITLKAIDQGTCIGSDKATVSINIFTFDTFVEGVTEICEGEKLNIIASGGSFYEWTDSTGVVSQNALLDQAPSKSQRYFLKTVGVQGCVVLDTVHVKVVPGYIFEYSLDLEYTCEGRPIIKVNNTTEEAGTYLWDFGDGNTSDFNELIYQHNLDGTYEVKLLGLRDFCVFEAVERVPSYYLKIPNIITPVIADNKNDFFEISYADAASKPVFALKVFNRWGKLVYEDENYQNTWAAEGLQNGIYYYEVKINSKLSCRSWLHVQND